jgi:hypothetical protein
MKLIGFVSAFGIGLGAVTGAAGVTAAGAHPPVVPQPVEHGLLQPELQPTLQRAHRSRPHESPQPPNRLNSPPLR